MPLRVFWSISRLESLQNLTQLSIVEGVGAKAELNSMEYRLAGDHGEVLTLKSPTPRPSRHDLKPRQVAHAFCRKHVSNLEPHTSGKFLLRTHRVRQARTPRRHLSSPLTPNLIKPEVINHQSGLRPTTHDRRPYIGALSDEPGVYIVNGLGTCGVLIVPTIIKKFIESLSV